MGCPIPTSFLEVSDYLKPKGPDGDMLDIGSFAQLEVTTQRDEIEDVGTLEISKAPVENIPSHGCSNKKACSRGSSCYRSFYDQARHHYRACLH